MLHRLETIFKCKKKTTQRASWTFDNEGSYKVNLKRKVWLGMKLKERSIKRYQ